MIKRMILILSIILSIPLVLSASGGVQTGTKPSTDYGVIMKNQTQILTRNYYNNTYNNGDGGNASGWLDLGSLVILNTLTDKVSIGQGSGNIPLTINGTETSGGSTILRLDTNTKTIASGGSLIMFAHGGQNISQIFASSGSSNLAPYLALHVSTDAGQPSERMRITEDGYVGVGTTIPTHKLSITGTTGSLLNISGTSGDIFTSVGARQLLLTGMPVGGLFYNAPLVINSINAGDQNRKLIGVGVRNVESFSVDVEGDTNISGNLTVDTNTFYVNSIANRVGIGTIKPEDALQLYGGQFIVNDTVGSTGTSEQDGSVLVERTNAGIVFGSRLAGATSSTNRFMIYQDTGNTYYRSITTGDNLRFGTDNSDDMTIFSGGTVAINNVTPESSAYMLTVQGGLFVAGIANFRGTTNYSTTVNYNGGYVRFPPNPNPPSGSDVPGGAFFNSTGNEWCIYNGGYNCPPMARAGVLGVKENMTVGLRGFSVKARSTLDVNGTISVFNKSGADALYLGSDGKVSIGTATPVSRLTVIEPKDNIALFRASNPTDARYITIDDSSLNSVLYLGSESSTGVNLFGSQYAYGVSIGTSKNVNLSFHTNNVAIPRLTIKNDGEIRIPAIADGNGLVVCIKPITRDLGTCNSVVNITGGCTCV